MDPHLHELCLAANRAFDEHCAAFDAMMKALDTLPPEKSLSSPEFKYWLKTKAIAQVKQEAFEEALRKAGLPPPFQRLSP